jgi:hypothetical protein
MAIRVQTKSDESGEQIRRLEADLEAKKEEIEVSF